MKIKNYVAWTENGDELVVINTNTQKCLVLDKCGKAVWGEFLEQDNINEVVDILVTEFSYSDPSEIKKDVYALLELLVQYEIIDYSEETH